MFPVNLDPSRTLIGWLIRHGELKNMDIWDGWGNYTLSAAGRESAEKAAQYLSFEKIGRVVSSDVPRTIETAQCIMNNCDVACPYLACEPNIRPWMVGIFTGQEKTRERKDAFKFYVKNPSIPIPEGESRDQLEERIQVIGQYLASPYMGLPTAIATHNSVLKLLMGEEVGVDPGGVVAVYMKEHGELEFEVVLGEDDTEDS